MKKEWFWGAFGYERLPVEISQVAGTNGLYHVMVNKFYQGEVFQMPTGEWVGYLEGRYITQGDDINILIDFIRAIAEE